MFFIRKYLQQIFISVELATKENLKVKPSKIVAGHEAEKTNELLQAIGKALEKNIDSTEAVEIVRNGGKLIKPHPGEARAATKPPAAIAKTGANSKLKQEVENKSKLGEKLPKKSDSTKTRSKEKNTSNVENEKQNSVKNSTNSNVATDGNVKEIKKNGENINNEAMPLNTSVVLKSTEPMHEDAVENVRNGGGKHTKPQPGEPKQPTAKLAALAKSGTNSKLKQDVEKKSKVVEKLTKKPELTKKRSKEKQDTTTNDENEKQSSKTVKNSTNLIATSDGNVSETRKNGESRKEELNKSDLVNNEDMPLNGDILKSTEPKQILTNNEENSNKLETYHIPSKFGKELSHAVIEQSNINTSTAPIIELAEQSVLTPTLVTLPSKNASEPIQMIENNFHQIPSSKSNAELSDIIDQEAEMRRQERSAKKERKKSSSGHRDKPLLNEIKNDIDQNTNETLSSLKVSNKQMDLIKEEENSVTQMNNINARSQIPRPRTSLRPPSVRPASARPGAPRRHKNIEIVLQPDESVQMAGIGVRVNSFDNDLDDEGDNLIIIEDPTVVESNLSDLLPANMTAINSGGSSKDDSGIGSDSSSQQGHLVQQILETQQKFSKINQDVDVSRNMAGDDVRVNCSLFFST